MSDNENKDDLDNVEKTEFLSDFSKEIWEQTYRYHTDTNLSKTFYRIAEDLASDEKEPDKWTQKFYDSLTGFKVVPGGRISSNAGTGLHGTTYINCYVDGPVVEDKDSISGIFNAVTRAALTLKSEGGYGFCCDFIRPRGTFIHGVGVETPGAVEMLKLWDVTSAVITKGSGQKKKTKQGKSKIRKGAMMVTMSCWHPDVMEFITAKTIPGNLTKFNMSILCTNDFMEAVKKNAPWNLVFPDTTHKDYKTEWDGDLNNWQKAGRPVKVCKTVQAAELWDMIMSSTYNRNEPGVLFVDRMNELNNLWYEEKISATNPCVVGETLVAVADGRGEVPIKQLAEEGKDVPVYCVDDKNKLAIRMMRNPRITGHDQKIYLVTMDDGSKIKCTGNHKFKLSSGEYVEAKSLKQNDSLFIMTKALASIKDVIPSANSNSQDYIWANCTGHKTWKSDHRFIAAFHNNLEIPKGYVVHHKDFNAQNNAPTNLEVMSREDHDKLHGFLIRGENNPMVKAKKNWTKEQWKKYRGVSSPSVSSAGEDNGKYSGITNETLKEHAITLTKKLGRRFSTNEWQKYAKEHGLTEQFSNWRLNNLGGSCLGFSQWAAVECGLDNDFVKWDPRLQQTYLTFAKKGFNCKVQNGKVLLEKECEVCSLPFWTWSQKREIGICSSECTSKYTIAKNKDQAFIEKATLGQRKFQAERKEKVRVQQIQIYLNLKEVLNREPLRKEWEEECKQNGLAFRLGASSPFKNFTEVKESSQLHNHRVSNVSILSETETVYNGTVDNFHNFFIGSGIESKNIRFEKPSKSYFCIKQCGEQILPLGGVCLLGSINLTQFITEDRTNWDYDKLKEHIPVFVRLLDNVNDRTLVPLPEQKWNLENKRRIGVGYMGYGSALYMMKLKYGSKAALKLTDELCNFITNQCYQASAMLAKEKGSFPLFDKTKYLKSKFVKQALSKETIDMIGKYGLRNSHLTSIQPTGNSSIYANNVSGGLEPVVSAEYFRTSIVGVAPEGLALPVVDWEALTFTVEGSTEWKLSTEGDEEILITKFEDTVYKFDRNRGLCKETLVEDYAVKQLKAIGDWEPDADWAANIFNLSIDEHIDTMSVFAKYIDAAMSKTINVPNDYPYEDFKKLYVSMFDSGVIKGGTTYRHGTMTTVVSDKGTDFDNDGRPTKIMNMQAPKRAASLPCEIHQATVKGTPWTVLLGMMGETPYEIFMGYSENISLPKKCKLGKIIKVKKGRYDLHVDMGGEDLIVKNIVKVFDNPEGAWATRMVSMSLRHGTPIDFVVEQLAKDGNMMDANKVLSRILKKFIKSGALVRTSMSCPQCSNATLTYVEGCASCASCGWQKC